MQAAEETDKTPVVAANFFSTQFKTLLETGSHSDIVFIVGDELDELPAHKAILSARYPDNRVFS